jgi:uncharacterized protein
VFDPAKDAANIAKHGLSLAEAVEFEMNRARVSRDTRRNYGEARFVAVGPLRRRLCVLIFTVRDGAVRVISLRRANAREVARYGR